MADLATCPVNHSSPSCMGHPPSYFWGGPLLLPWFCFLGEGFLTMVGGGLLLNHLVHLCKNLGAIPTLSDSLLLYGPRDYRSSKSAPTFPVWACKTHVPVSMFFYWESPPIHLVRRPPVFIFLFHVGVILPSFCLPADSVPVPSFPLPFPISPGYLWQAQPLPTT